MPQYFASFKPFEIFDEFNGVAGTYIKSFLISDKVNLNKWQTTHEANIANLDTFLGRPGIHYINPENGKRDHTGPPALRSHFSYRSFTGQHQLGMLKITRTISIMFCAQI